MTEFEMPIDDVFSISGVGYVATGCIARGEVRLGDSLLAIADGGQQLCEVQDIMLFGTEGAPAPSVASAAAGAKCGLRLRGFDPRTLCDGNGVPIQNQGVRVAARLATAPPGARTELRVQPPKPWWKLW